MQYLITIILVAFDFLTGWAQSVYNKTFKSCIMREGMFHKLAILAVLVLTALFDWARCYIDLGVMSAAPISAMVCSGFTIMEIGSALENLHKINSDIPSGFSGLLEIGKKKED